MIVYIHTTDDGPPSLFIFYLTLLIRSYCWYILRPTMSSSIPANMDLAALVTIGVSRLYASYIIKVVLIRQGAVYIAHHCWAFDKFKCLVPSRKDWFRVLLTVSFHYGLLQPCLTMQVDASFQRRLLVHLGQRICE